MAASAISLSSIATGARTRPEKSFTSFPTRPAAGKGGFAAFPISTTKRSSSASPELLHVSRVLSRPTESTSAIFSDHEEDLLLQWNDQKDEDDGRGHVAQQEELLCDTWRKIHGEDDWSGMLDPMDPHLRSELLRYGDMAQACYDAFDFDPFSKYCGSCRFPRRSFFHSLEMGGCGYNITRYLYATSSINLPNFFKKSRWPKVWSKNANWIGYVAVSDDELSRRLGRRDIAIAWRGTVTRFEWIADMMDFLKPVSSNRIPCPDPAVKAESGFLDLYTDKDKNCKYCKYSAREQILAEVKRIIEAYPNEELSITMTGHSLGAALAILSAYDLVETGVNVTPDGRTVPMCVFSYSGPRVGNVRFKERLEDVLGVKVLRVHNVQDVVPKAPGLFLNEGAPKALMRAVEWLPWSYSHVGVELALDQRNSPFLKDTSDPVCCHNLEALLHLIDGYHGKGHRFVLASGRDPALVNKAADFLKDHYLVPPFWKQDHNKGLVRNHDGRWMQPERSQLDDHHYDDLHHHITGLGLLHDS